MTRAREVIALTALIALAGCGGGGSDREGADQEVVKQVESSSSCSDVQRIADAHNARYEAYPEGAARDEARQTFLAASDRLIELECPGW